MTAFLEKELRRKTLRIKIALLNLHMKKIFTNCDDDHKKIRFYFDANHHERFHRVIKKCAEKN
jgi:hypothetical protein